MKEPLIVKKNKLGKGVFATRDIRKDEKICTMAGDKITSDQLHKVTSLGRNILFDPLQVSDNIFINMSEPYVLINHSCSPNAGIKGKDILVAIKNIRKDEEILYDYGTVWYEGFTCKCGKSNCRGQVSSFFTMPKAAQKRYLKLGIVPDFIKNKIKD